MISEAELKDWLQHPVTIEFRKVLNTKRAALREQWERSEPAAYTKDELILVNVANIGWCRGLAFAETFDYEDYTTEIGVEDEQSKRPPASGGSSAT